MVLRETFVSEWLLMQVRLTLRGLICVNVNVVVVGPRLKVQEWVLPATGDTAKIQWAETSQRRSINGGG
jgi:hypothetical protein